MRQLLLLMLCASIASAQATGPLRVSGVNKRYLVSAADTTRAIFYAGSSTFATEVDVGTSDPPPHFPTATFISFMKGLNQNGTRAYYWEQSKGRAEDQVAWWVLPNFYSRTGPGNAIDGKAKFDLTKPNAAYLDTLKARINAFGANGIYFDLELFNGWSVDSTGRGNGSPWKGHPYNQFNNINGLNGDASGNDNGEETHSLVNNNAWAYEVAYIKTMVDSLNDCPNLVWSICNEVPMTQGWIDAIADTIHNYELRKPYQHPIVMGGDWTYSNATLFTQHVQIVSPGAGNNGTIWETSPPDSNGTRIVFLDTDHLWGYGGTRVWAWEGFTRGVGGILFTDAWNNAYNDPSWGSDSSQAWAISLRQNCGWLAQYAKDVPLLQMVPTNAYASTAYCLYGAHYWVAYQPGTGGFTMNLSATTDSLSVEWFHPTDGTRQAGANVKGGGSSVTMTPPWSGDVAVRVYTDTTSTQTITATAGAGGSISPSGNVVVNQSNNKMFAITPNGGYAITSLTVDGVGQSIASTYTFTDVQTAHTISATFALVIPSSTAFMPWHWR